MKFHLQATGTTTITGLGDGWIRVGATEHRTNLLITPEAVMPDWVPGGFAALAPEDFARLLEQRPEIVLFGTGATQRFPHPRLTRALAEAQVGVEVMDTRAACRTFNILAAEGRRVVAALLIDPQSG